MPDVDFARCGDCGAVYFAMYKGVAVPLAVHKASDANISVGSCWTECLRYFDFQDMIIVNVSEFLSVK